MFTIRYWNTSLPFEYPFTISKGTKDTQSTFIVELNWRGIASYGEAPAIAYYDITVDKMVADLEAKRKFIESFSFTEPKRFWHFLHHLFPNNPFLVCALDMAGWDLYGKIRGKPLFDIWQLDLNKAPQTDYTIGIDTVDAMVEKVIAHPAPMYKIKVGTSHDLELLEQIRQCTHAKIRIDANGGWTLEQALAYLPKLESLDIELIEQPLPKEDFGNTAILKSKTTIPIFADESCVNKNDIVSCEHSFSGINIKLTKASGISPALDMIKQARSLKLKVMLGCMNESSIGTAALVNLSPLVDYLDADGPLLLSQDTASGLVYNNYQITTTGLPGLGIKPNEAFFSQST